MPYLIDGNNLLGSWGGPRDDDDGRAEVVRRVAAFCRARNVKATVVFDGHPLRPDMAAQELGLVSLRVPPRGEDADTVIRELVERAPRPAELVVVTSDKALYSYVKTLGASRATRARVERSRASRPGARAWRELRFRKARPRGRRRGLAEEVRRFRVVPVLFPFSRQVSTSHAHRAAAKRIAPRSAHEATSRG